MKKYKAILFDLDGTLLDSLNDIANAANRVLSKRQFPAHPVDAYKYFVGDGTKTLFARALPEDKRSDSIIQICMKEFEQEYSKNWNDETSLYPGIEEMLDLIQDHGFKMAILSNKPQEFTQYCVDAFLYKWPFEEVSGFQTSLPPKPDPSAALTIARRMGISPASFLYLGDTGVDMKTAVSAGMYPIGALWGFRSSDELTENGAKVVVDHPLEVADLCG